MYGRLQVVQYMFPLLDDKSPKNEYGRTPLDVAEREEKDEVADFIKEYLK
jgi:hypothetical protein